MLTGWTGCREPANIAPGVDPVGTYTLVSVDGNKVPCRAKHGEHELTVSSGTFIIRADGTCNSKMAFIPPSGSEVVREVRATYTRQGAKLTMKWERAGITSGTVSGDTFTMNNEGMILAYRK